MILLALMACKPDTAAFTVTPTNTDTAIPTVGPADATTPSGYEQYTVEHLRARMYGGGKIEIVQGLAEQDDLAHYLIRYPSDGLTIYGFAIIPKSKGPHPVIIAIHGYVPRDTYANPNYDAGSLSQIARDGFIIIHPFLRNYAPSDDGENLFRVGMSVDVLNLIALVRSGNMPNELLSSAAQDRIGLWGYSMGGGIALRVLTVSEDVKAAVLYSSTSGDESKNAELLWRLSFDPIYQTEMLTLPEELKAISPVNFYRYITAPIQIFHGRADSTVPVMWAGETCAALEAAHVEVNCKYFAGEDHSFRSRVADEFLGMMLAFYRKHLAP